jgi:DNA-binding NarL/FixJ family response regulator
MQEMEQRVANLSPSGCRIVLAAANGESNKDIA